MPAKTKNRYSEQRRAECLAALTANGGNVLRTAKLCGIPRKTLALWAKEQADGRQLPEVAEKCHRKIEDLREYLEEVAWKLAEALPSKIQEAGLKDTSVALGVAIDKSRLLAGKSTSITGHTVEEQRRETVSQMLEKLTAKGITEEDARRSLIDLGVDPADLPTAA